jgi:nitroreductase
MEDNPYPQVPLAFERLPAHEMLTGGQDFLATLMARRSVRSFSPDPVPRQALELAIAAAHSAPSGANRQPWHFVAISDPAVKREIRSAAEKVEREFYEGGRATDEWLEALSPLGTGWSKPYLETAPWLVVVFKEVHGVDEDGGKITNYYVNESVGIACGLFIASLQTMGLATLTHTPQPMRFLATMLDRPANERPYILFPVGYPAPDCQVPDISKKSLGEVTTWRESRD